MLGPMHRAMAAVLRVAMGHPPGPVLLNTYRKRFFGDNFVKFMNSEMRRPRHWSRGEMELFAAFVSRLNGCGY
jgi:hypothetical protein